MKPSCLIRNFILLVKRDQLGDYYYPQDPVHSHSLHNAKLPCIQRWLPRNCLKGKTCVHRVHWNCKSAYCLCTLPYLKLLNAICCLHR